MAYKERKLTSEEVKALYSGMNAGMNKKKSSGNNKSSKTASKSKKK